MVSAQTPDPDDLPASAERASPTILFVPSFGDGAEVYEPLHRTVLSSRYRLLAIDLPGFAGTKPLNGPTTLEALADVVHGLAMDAGARVVVAHSVASIIASLAARRPGSPIGTIIALEGNLTAADAYFSGMAADYADPAAFRQAFLDRLGEMARTQPIVQRYREIVGRADPQALWELGCDARRFSETHVPGDVLREAATVWYLYNPANCPPATLDWLRRTPLQTIRLDGASHWPSVDQPDLLAKRILEVLGDR